MRHIPSSSNSRRIRAARTHRTAAVGLAGVAVVLVIGARHPRSLDAAPRFGGDSLTFAADVAPILYRNCVSCHRPGGIAPFSMLDFDTVTGRLKDFSKVLQERKMPPWFAVAPPGTFRNERGISESERRTIQRWIATGAAFGDSASLPAPPSFPDGWEIGKPDVVLTMQEEFHVPARGTLDYMHFQVPTNFTEDKWIQAIEIRPGAPDVVHHVLVYARAPSPPTPNAGAAATHGHERQVLLYDSVTSKVDEIPRKDSLHAPPKEMGELIATKAPGTNVVTFPEGTALRVPAGSILILQLHYSTNGHARSDRTSIGFRFAKGPPREEIIAGKFYNAQFTIPAGAKDVMVPSTVGFNEPVRIYGLFAHTHMRGTRWQYTLVRPDGSSEVILDVPKYDFNWQTYYLFAKPLEIPAGSRIIGRAWYDNSAGNEHNPDPTVTVHFGDQTWEEMQYTGMLYSVVPATPSSHP